MQRFHEEECFRLEPIGDELWAQAVRLNCTRPDQDWGLTDCVSFALMERKGIREALTADPRFRQAGFVPLLLEPEMTT